jgi:membrane-associated phospholipid phosphatase
MIFATVVTANHYFLDAVGGWATLAVCYALAGWRAWLPWTPGTPANPRDQDGIGDGRRRAGHDRPSLPTVT